MKILAYKKGIAYNNLKKVLQQCLEIYNDRIPEGLYFKLYKNGRASHILKVNSSLNNTLFFFLINYLKYPEGFEYNITVEGFKTGKDNNHFNLR